MKNFYKIMKQKKLGIQKILCVLFCIAYATFTGEWEIITISCLLSYAFFMITRHWRIKASR